MFPPEIVPPLSANIPPSIEQFPPTVTIRSVVVFPTTMGCEFELITLKFPLMVFKFPSRIAVADCEAQFHVTF